jgi:H+/Cl- antiporter ClcA/CBS domain-containing protein
MVLSSRPTGKKLRDYSADSRIVSTSILGAMLGGVAALAAWMLLEMIALFTNLFYFHRWSFVSHDPWQAGEHWWVVLVPVVGGLIVGLIAKFLAPQVRGHGMPEAVETIVFGGGKVRPRVAVLKPLATAISIGSGGPFGAEGPVIITGGAIGSVVGQLLPTTDSERKVLMVAGAAAGMAATFNCPMSAVLLAVEIFLFEWKPRSLVPVAIACVTAGAVRRLLLGPESLLTMPATSAPLHHSEMIGALLVGIVAAFLAAFLAKAVHTSEHMFEKLTKLGVHWMWWPAIGGLGIGLGGLIFPRGLGVGYSVIQQMLSGDDITWKLLAGVLLVKTSIWIFSLGSETAGGILAPLLMIGGALGAACGHFMPFMSIGAWVLVGMTSLLSASIGAPLTCAMLALELTHNGGLMLPVLLGCVAAYAVSVLVMPRSMLTESLSRRGLHLSREYGVDPLETILVGRAMHTSVFALPSVATRKDAVNWYRAMKERGDAGWSHWQRVFPLVDEDGHLLGMLTRGKMVALAEGAEADASLAERPLMDDARREPFTLSPLDTVKSCAELMAESKLTAYPVVDADEKLVGVMTLEDVLKGRSEQTRREMHRERAIRLRWPFAMSRGAEKTVEEETAVK